MQTIGQYDLIEKVAEGGMGTVYKGRHRISGDIVAVKVVPPHIASNPVYLKRFEQEYTAARALDHPNIVRAVEFGREDSTPYLVMEFVEGESLGQRLDREHRIGEAEAIRIIAQVARGLDRAHGLGLVHRDVKPDNILLTHYGEAKLTDLGLVKELDADLNLTRTGRGLGTPHFMAPEQFRNAKNADFRCDIYSLAATLYMTVTGELPFDSAGPLDAWMRKVKNDIVPPQQLVPELSSRVDWAICRALNPDPAQRPASCSEFVDDLTGPDENRTHTPPEDVLSVTLANLWHLLYRDPAGLVHMTRETTEGVRQAIQDGSLGEVAEIRLSRKPIGPFEPPVNFPEFRDVTQHAALVPAATEGCANEAPAAEAVEAAAVACVPPPTPLAAARVVSAVSAGPLIDLGQGRRSTPWLVWLTLLALAASAAAIGYLVLPGLRWRWFNFYY
jgi:serine/threonine protein kinase